VSGPEVRGAALLLDPSGRRSTGHPVDLSLHGFVPSTALRTHGRPRPSRAGAWRVSRGVAKSASFEITSRHRRAFIQPMRRAVTTCRDVRSWRV